MRRTTYKITVFSSNNDNIVEYSRMKEISDYYSHYTFKRYIVNSDYSMKRLQYLFEKYPNNVAYDFESFPIAIILTIGRYL